MVALAVVSIGALAGTLDEFGSTVTRAQGTLVPLLTLQGSVTAGSGVDVLLRSTPDAVVRYQQQVTRVEHQFDANSLYTDSDVASAVTRSRGYYRAATAVISRWSTLSAQQQTESAMTMREEYSANITRTRETLSPAIARSQDLTRADLAHTRRTVARDTWIIGLTGLLAVVVGVLVATRQGRSVLTPLGQLQVSVARLGGGDLHHRLVVDRPDEFGAVATAVNMMGTQLQRQHEDLAHRVAHDHLTGLGNRVMLRDTLGAAAPHPLVSEPSPALLFIDLDDFKTINDSLGHTVGDALLCAVADRLASSIRSADTAFRLGGDEFAVLLDDVGGSAEAEVVATHVLAAFAEPFAVSEHRLRVTCSIGVALAEQARSPGSALAALRPDQRVSDTGAARAGVHRDDLPPSEPVGTEGLLEAADLAMYAAKRTGKNQVRLYEPAMLATVSERMALEAELRTAVGAGQLRVQYQPIVDLSTGSVRGCEALVRWQHPRRGLLGPDAFVPLAEQTGAIVELTSLVLRTALQQVARWRHLGLWPEGARMAVNISPQHLQQPGLVELITRCLDDADLSGQVLTAEITESALLDFDGLHGRSILAALRRLGTHVAVDDFGTGYSNLSRMQDFPLDVLKIDRSFLRPLLDGSPAPLAAAVITLGGTLGLATVAEGVETPAQAAWLLHQGCSYGQGFLYDRPLSASDFTCQLVRTGEPPPQPRPR